MKNIDAEIQQIYERMVPEIQKEIESFYQRYADKEGISLAEAKKRVSKFDVRAFEARAAKMVKERDFSNEANELMRLYNATMRINRLELLKADIGLHMIDGFDDLEKLTGEKLTEEAVKEFERQAGILGHGVKGAFERAKSLVGQSFMNATFSERIWSNQEALRNKLSTILTKGLIGGKSYQSLAAEIRKDFSVSAREAMRLVRTEMVRVQTQAQIDSYKANGWEEFEFLAYGTASCEICNALNKKHFKISDFQPAENAPPMHPNCRCRTAPYEDEEEYQKWLDSFGNSGKTVDSTGKSNIINTTKLANMKKRGELPPPMDEKLYRTMVAGLAANGVKVISAKGDDLAYLKALGAEASIAGTNTILHMGEIPSASALFEEIIHITQCRLYGELKSTDPKELYIREIMANRKLLRHRKEYRFTDDDTEDIQRNLATWEEKFKKLTGADFDESGIDRKI